MKKIIFILFAIIILSCSHNYKKSDLIGTWGIVSSTNIETGEVEFPPEGDDEVVTVEIRLDSLDFDDNLYAWKIKGDSIIIDGLASVFIKELTSTRLTVEFDSIDGNRWTFRKIK